MHHIVFLDRGTLPTSIEKPRFPHTWEEYDDTMPDLVVSRLINADVVISNKVNLSESVIASLPNLKMIAVCATGTNNVDLHACNKRNIVVSNIPSYAKHAVAEHTFLLILALRRQLMGFRADIEAGLWQRATTFCLFTHDIKDLHGSTLGIVGRGTLGQAVANIAQAFGMRVVFAERKNVAVVREGFTPFEVVLADSDVVSLHCPLIPETRFLIGMDELMTMRRDAILINTARGGLVNEDALVYALKNRIIAGAACDVLSVEPPHEDNPLLKLKLSNFILTPHVAWASTQAMRLLASQLIENIEAFVAGTPKNRVN